MDIKEFVSSLDVQLNLNNSSIIKNPIQNVNNNIILNLFDKKNGKDKININVQYIPIKNGEEYNFPLSPYIVKIQISENKKIIGDKFISSYDEITQYSIFNKIRNKTAFEFMGFVDQKKVSPLSIKLGYLDENKINNPFINNDLFNNFFSMKLYTHIKPYNKNIFLDIIKTSFLLKKKELSDWLMIDQIEEKSTLERFLKINKSRPELVEDDFKFLLKKSLAEKIFSRYDKKTSNKKYLIFAGTPYINRRGNLKIIENKFYESNGYNYLDTANIIDQSKEEFFKYLIYNSNAWKTMSDNKDELSMFLQSEGYITLDDRKNEFKNIYNFFKNNLKFDINESYWVPRISSFFMKQGVFNYLGEIPLLIKNNEIETNGVVDLFNIALNKAINSNKYF